MDEPSSPPEVTPQTLREWRERSGLSVRQAAKLLGVSPGEVSRWENGLRPITGPAMQLVRLFVAGAVVGLAQVALEEWTKARQRKRS